MEGHCVHITTVQGYRPAMDTFVGYKKVQKREYQLPIKVKVRAETSVRKVFM